MNRLQRKCVIASTGLHLLLICILFIGPAFIAPKKNDPALDLPLLEFVPIETVDEMMSGGGNPNARPPAALPNVRPDPKAPMVEPTPAPPEVKPQPVKKAPEPEPQTEPEAAPEKSTEASMEPTPNVRKKPQISLKQVIRKPGTGKNKPDASDREAREYADSRQKLARALGSAANGLPGTIGGSTTLEYRGPGGGGIPYANFLQAVKTVYNRAWVLPDGVAESNATVSTEVTIARDGTVVDARITRSSGNAAVDQSVASTLKAVKYVAPIPRNSKDNQRTVPIEFDVKAKRSTG